MASWWNRLFFKSQSDALQPTSLATIDCIDADIPELQYCADLESDDVRAWITPDGDLFSLNFFPIPPDLPRQAKTLEDFETFYTGLFKDMDGRVHEVLTVKVDGLLGLRKIFSFPQKPTGRVYIGSITLPFEICSYVLKVECEERPITGIRDTILFNRYRESGGELPVGDGAWDLPGWNPDASEHDDEFPNHPVSRARRFLDLVTSAVRADKSLQDLSAFPLPGIDSSTNSPNC